jgi:hypothetical protein
VGKSAYSPVAICWSGMAPVMGGGGGGIGWAGDAAVVALAAADA